MSRVLIFGHTQQAAGELDTTLNRGWMLAGNPAVTGGGSTTVTLTEAQAEQSFLQFGNMALVSHPKLPNWAGMIDGPWGATAPVNMVVYNAEYLLSLRTPESASALSGSVAEIATQMLEQFNAGDDLFVRIGDTARADSTKRQETLDGRTYWDQLSKLLERSGCEMQTRAERDASGRLVIYLDIAERLGQDSGYLYSDGNDGNAVFREAKLDGPIINRVTGLGDESGQLSRLRTTPFFDLESISQYRMRSEMVQFRDVRELGTLDLYSQVYLNQRSSPRFTFIMDILDKGDAFMNARLGNQVMAHFSKARLPGGVRGWRGPARILAMAYTEDQNLLSALMEIV